MNNLKVGDLLEWHMSGQGASARRWYALVIKLEEPHIWVKWLANGDVEDVMNSSANIRVVSRK